MTNSHEQARRQAAQEQEAILAQELKDKETRAANDRAEKQRDRQLGEEFL